MAMALVIAPRFRESSVVKKVRGGGREVWRRAESVVHAEALGIEQRT